MPGVAPTLPTLLVLDTNIVIDWLVFNDEFMKPLRDAVADRRATVLTSTPATGELQRVLAYPELKLDAVRQAAVFDRYLLQTSPASLPDGFSLANLLLPPTFPRCRDPDDQHFLALAWHSRAMLASRDKAVLKLRKRAARFGVAIVDVQQLIGRLQHRE
ncbi:MAG: putative toxin-antitoxin system toxin component, PIN family [Steroidobacteraceae bacterium]